MPRFKIDIQTIFDGLMPSDLFGQSDEFTASVGVDPDVPRTDGSSDVKASGIIRPVTYSKFSGASVTSWPIKVITTPKDRYIYVVLSNGRLLRYDNDFTNETFIFETDTRIARGAWYYNNYIYITTGTDVARYGPLNSPSFSNNVWTASTLGGQTALVDTPYPTSLLSVGYLNHWGIEHVDGASYFLDYKNGIGMVHKIKTTRTTNEGDTNNGSTYNVLDLPPNYLPITIISWGNDLVVAAAFSTDGNIIQGKAALFFFNPADTTPSYYKVVNLPDTLCTALEFANGALYGFSGDPNSDGYRLFQYVGGDTIQTLKMIEGGNPPLQGAVAAASNKLAWAADLVDPMVASGLYAYGSKSDLFPRGLHHIAIDTFQ